MASESERRREAAAAAIASWRPFCGPMPAPERAGCLRTLREADDDAQTIHYFVQVGMATHAIDPAEVVWIIDLAPGDGERAWRVLQRLSGCAPRGAPIRYLACCPSSPHRARLAGHPRLRPLIADGRLFLDAQGAGIPAHAVRNPAVVLAHEGLSSQSQGLYAAHCGELLQAWDDGAGNVDWRALGRRDGLLSLLSSYRQCINSAALTLPQGAMQTLDALLRLCGGRLLLRASDLGAKDLAQIRMGALDRRPEAPLPVNFDALARWHRTYGASVHQAQRDDDGRVLHIALHDVAGGRLHECLPDVLALPHPDDRAQLLQGLRHASYAAPAQCLAMLQALGGDPRALLALSRPIADAAPGLVGTALTQWRAMLAQCWAQHYPCGDDEGFRTRVAALAMGMEDWPLARAATRSMLRATPQDAAGWQALAQIQLRSGGARAATLSLKQAQAAAGEGARARDMRDELAARMAAWRQRPGYCAGLARDRQLVLEPLDVQHAADMHYQYRDPQIGQMARLPAFADVAALRAWIERHASDGKRLDCAAMHAVHGFVGVVSGHWQRESAFVHFWLGADHQGKGLAAPAVRLLLRLLTAHGMRHVFAAVYPDNYRSLRVLKRLGFVDLPLRAMAPEDALAFLAWAPQADTAVSAHCSALRAFSCDSGSTFQFSDIDTSRGAR